MKNLILSGMAVLFCNWIYASIIVVDNNYPSMGNYTTLQAAHDAASNGDTLLIYPSQAPYAALQITKKLTLIGSGFTALQPELKTTIIEGELSFLPGSDASTIKGFGGFFSVIINANNVIIARNQISHILVIRNHTGTAILQNYISGSTHAELVNILPNNVAIVSNNILYNTYQSSYMVWTLLGQCLWADSITNTTTITNNIMRPRYNCSYYCLSSAMVIGNSNAFVANNIIYGSTISGSNSGFFNNMSNEAQIPATNGNLPNIDPYTVFTDFDHDNFHLKPASPATGTGYNGTDMGIYGGDSPFVDGGYPDIPSIYYLDVPMVGTQQGGINIRVKARSNN